MGQIPVSVAKKKVNKHFAGQNNYHGKMRQLKRFFFSPLPLLVVTGGRVWDLFSHMLLLSNFYWIQGSLCCHGCIEGCKCGGTETCLFESISTLGVQNSVLKTLPILPVWFCTNKIRDPRGATFNYPGEVSQMMSHTRHRPNCCVFFFLWFGGGTHQVGSFISMNRNSSWQYCFFGTRLVKYLASPKRSTHLFRKQGAKKVIPKLDQIARFFVER